MNTKPHLDEEALAELQDVMEDEFEILIHTFINDSRERVAGLRHAIESRDTTAVAHTAHSFKGSCINIGAPQLGELCRQVEAAGKAEDLAETPALLQAIESEFHTVCGLLEGLLVR